MTASADRLSLRDVEGVPSGFEVRASLGFETFDGSDLGSFADLRGHAEAALREAKRRGGDRGVYKTTDGGRTWKKTLYLNDSTGAMDVELQPGNPSVVYAWMNRIAAVGVGRREPTAVFYDVFEVL